MHQSSTYSSCLSYQAEVMFSAAQHRLLCAPYLFFMLYFDSAFSFAIIRSSIAMEDAAAIGLLKESDGCKIHFPTKNRLHSRPGSKFRS
jgi:hypothetical protein